MHASVLLCINQHTKFKVPNFTNFKDMIGAKFKKNWLGDPPRQLGGSLSSEG